MDSIRGSITLIEKSEMDSLRKDNMVTTQYLSVYECPLYIMYMACSFPNLEYMHVLFW